MSLKTVHLSSRWQSCIYWGTSAILLALRHVYYSQESLFWSCLSPFHLFRLYLSWNITTQYQQIFWNYIWNWSEMGRRSFLSGCLAVWALETIKLQTLLLRWAATFQKNSHSSKIGNQVWITMSILSYWRRRSHPYVFHASIIELLTLEHCFFGIWFDWRTGAAFYHSDFENDVQSCILGWHTLLF